MQRIVTTSTQLRVRIAGFEQPLKVNRRVQIERIITFFRRVCYFFWVDTHQFLLITLT